LYGVQKFSGHYWCIDVAEIILQFIYTEMEICMIYILQGSDAWIL